MKRAIQMFGLGAWNLFQWLRAGRLLLEANRENYYPSHPSMKEISLSCFFFVA